MSKKQFRSAIALSVFLITLFLLTASADSAAESAQAQIITTTTPVPTTTTIATTTTTLPPTTTTVRTAPNRSISIGTGAVSSQITAPPVSDHWYLRDCIVKYESGGGVLTHDPAQYLAHNLTSTASGIGQWLDTTWNSWGGFVRALYAPVEVQEARLKYDLGLSLKHIQGEWAAQRSRCHF